jgi:cellulose synthase/poly-beta-1,6-N-acetylglucosamine synthase-like glycosyltransferase
MLSLIDFLVLFVVAAVGVPTAIVSIECLAGAFARPVIHRFLRDDPPKVVVMVPAHNEATVIADTLGAVRAQLGTAGRILVVADNCRDATASIARQFDAEVIERHSPTEHGKGFALDFGTRHLERDPPEVVVIVDADCDLAAGAIDILARAAHATGRPVQAQYVMHAPPGASPRLAAAAFAFLVRNVIRARGMAALGLPCHLMGTGMAFPWPVIRDAPLRTGDIAEDVRLGMDLSLAGTAPLFCEEAMVWSVFPANQDAERTQRTRWEHGHISTILRVTPHQLIEGLARRQASTVALSLDILVPPLTTLVLGLAMVSLAAMVDIVVAGGSTALVAVLALDVLFAASMGAAVVRLSRDGCDLRALRHLPDYLAGKVPIYRHLLSRPESTWTRTKRDSE